MFFGGLGRNRRFLGGEKEGKRKWEVGSDVFVGREKGGKCFYKLVWYRFSSNWCFCVVFWWFWGVKDEERVG